jgi:hypothetical protein
MIWASFQSGGTSPRMRPCSLNAEATLATAPKAFQLQCFDFLKTTCVEPNCPAKNRENFTVFSIE